MTFKESTRKYILLSTVILIVIGLVSAKVLAKKQNNEFVANEMLYEQAVQLYSTGNNDEASTLIEELLKKQPQSEIVNYLGGMIAAGNEDYGQAAVLLQKTLDINPHKVEDAMFMLQFAEVLVHVERNDDAVVILERCREAGWAPEELPTYQDRVTQLLTDIENKQ